jgi:hypothetical protein
MTLGTGDSQFPSLFAHTLRKDWGVGLLAGENDGKRRYLFENGEERTLASGFYEMMHRVERPNPDQLAAYTRLRGMLAARAHDSDAAGAKPVGWSVLDQLTRFRETYPEGLGDPKWAAEVRGEGAEIRAPRHRQATLREAEEQLSLKALDSRLSGQHFGQVWDQVVMVLCHTDLVPSAQLKLRPPSGEHQRTLALAVRELLHGKAVYGQRFDRYLAAFVAAFGKYPRWELATALSALVHPTEHVCVEPTVFRKQLKASSRPSVAAQPSSGGYAGFLGIARLIANKLAERGEVPRDLLDIRDFMAFTLKPAPKAQATRGNAQASGEIDSSDGDEA